MVVILFQVNFRIIWGVGLILMASHNYCHLFLMPNVNLVVDWHQTYVCPSQHLPLPISKVDYFPTSFTVHDCLNINKSSSEIAPMNFLVSWNAILFVFESIK